MSQIHKSFKFLASVVFSNILVWSLTMYFDTNFLQNVYKLICAPVGQRCKAQIHLVLTDYFNMAHIRKHLTR